MTSTNGPTYVLVHGAFSNAFGWTAVQRELALLGQRSLAVDLPGHGFEAPYPLAFQAPQDLEELARTPSPLAGVPHSANVEHVVDVARRVAAHGPVILVGHSRGGLTLTSVGNAIPELIDRIVYISAWCCVAHTPAEYAQSPEHLSSRLLHIQTPMIGDPTTLGAIRQNWRTSDPEVLANLKAVFLHDGTDEQLRAFLDSMDIDEGLDVGEDRGDPDTWGRIPRSYVRLTADEGLPIALQDRFIREADAVTPDNPFDVHSLDTSHVGMLFRAEQTAALLAGLAGGPRS